VAGGVGVSSITAALGLALRRLTQQRVALVDLGLQCGALSAILDLDPAHTITELTDPTSTIDSIRLKSVLSTHQSELYLPAAPRRIEEGEMISVSTVTATLTVMRELFDYILVDCGHQLSEDSVAAWEHSQHLIYLLNQSVSSMRPAQRFLDLFGRLDVGELEAQFVLNRYDRDNPFSIKQIETALERPLAGLIARDDAGFVQAQLAGADLAAAAPDSPSGEAIDSIARNISHMPQTANGVHRAAFFARLRSAVGL
jgi:pilus assembly protein CpaE